ncbi:TPA: rhodanese-like domain-containing protein [Candidatus Latescibacteria bacterium]|nr:rhodanese-like domain-containing protein [Candidatus Latescibacterota bacterium]
MPIKQSTPPEAKDLLDANPEGIYLDVRTEPEFEAGHPLRAINIPVAFPGAGGQMALNPDFVSVVEANIPKDAKIVCGCQVGGRSQMAADLMAQAGYSDLTNVRGGFGGLQDPATGEVIMGWQDEGYPVETGSTDENGYAALKSKM